MLPQGWARSIPRGFGEIPHHVAQLQPGETEGTQFAAQEPVLLSFLLSLSLLPWDLVRGCLADFLIHPSSFSPPYSPWILPHRLQFPYFTLIYESTLSYFLVLGKTAPQFLCWISFMGKDFNVCPALWSPCPTLLHSLSLPPSSSLFFLWFSVNPSTYQGWKHQQQAAHAYSILCFFSLL